MGRLARAAGAQLVVAAGTPPVSWDRRGAGAGGPWSAVERELAHVDFAPNRGAVFSAHQMGSVRMGGSVRDHPCDPWGRIRADDRADRVIRGLYVADGSLFPTGLGVNPMLTVMVLARRVAATVLAET